MSASDEWTEWHLTPRGWESGSDRTDGPGITEKEPPTDRVLTYSWREYLSSVFSKPDRSGEIQWQSHDQEAVDALLKKFGDVPKHLLVFRIESSHAGLTPHDAARIGRRILPR